MPSVHCAPVNRPSERLEQKSLSVFFEKRAANQASRALPKNRLASRAALTRSGTPAWRMSGFSAMVPPPVLHSATDADLRGIIASDGGKVPVWSLGIYVSVT